MKNNKGFAPIAIALVVVVVLALGGTAYYAGKSSNPNSQNVPQDNIINNSESNSESVEPSITLVSPNGGEKWKKGDKVKILWTGGKDIKTVNIRLNIQGDGEGQHFSASIASNVPNTGSYEWTVKELYAEVLGVTDLPTSNKYYVEIGGKSGGLFTITSSTPTLEKQIGYVKSIYQKNGKYYLDIDYVQWITDETTCRASNKWGEFNNGYCIINTNPLIRTLEIESTASVRVLAYTTADGKFGEYVAEGRNTTVSLLVKAFNDSSNFLIDRTTGVRSTWPIHDLFNIKINSSGKIIDLAEQYTP